jgi:hypothetical protein
LERLLLGYALISFFLTANPLDDVGNVQKREGVMIQGNWLTEDVLKVEAGETISN